MGSRWVIGLATTLLLALSGIAQAQTAPDERFLSLATSQSTEDLRTAASLLNGLAAEIAITDRIDMALSLAERLAAAGDGPTATGALDTVEPWVVALQRERPLEAVECLYRVVEIAVSAGDAGRAQRVAGDIVEIEKRELGADNPARLRGLEQLLRRTPKEAMAYESLEAEVAALRARAPSWGLQTATLGPNPPAVSRENFDLRTVHFVTTRARNAGGALETGYANRPGSAASYGKAVVSVPRARDLGRFAPTPWALVLEFRPGRDDSPRLTRIDTVAGAAAFRAGVRADVGASRRKEALVVVHGFNQSLGDGLRMTARLASDLEIDGAAVAFSWPSKDDLFGYVYDLDQAESTLSIDTLAWTIREVAAQTGAQRVYVIAHSMGNRVLVKALQKLGSAPQLERVVFASPDVLTSDFVYVAPKVRSLARGFTLYASKNDRALRFSGWMRAMSRAGDAQHLLSLPGVVDTVDTTKVSGSLLGHDDFLSGARDDLRAVIWQGSAPERRCPLTAREAAGTWEISRPSACDALAYRLAVLYLRRLNSRPRAIQALDQARAAAPGTDDGRRLQAVYREASNLLQAMP